MLCWSFKYYEEYNKMYITQQQAFSQPQHNFHLKSLTAHRFLCREKVTRKLQNYYHILSNFHLFLIFFLNLD